MASIGEVADRLAQVVELVGRCRDALATARALVEEARAGLALALEGAAGLEEDAARALDAFAGVADGVRDELGPLLEGIEARLEAVRAALLGEGGGARDDEPPAVPWDRVERLRRELPPPVVPNTGQKTHGRWIGPDGQARPIVSGRDDKSVLVNPQLVEKGIPDLVQRSSDVEMKLAAHMVAKGIRHATVVINHEPCKGKYNCDTLVPIILPEGSTLTVHGTNAGGMRIRVRYTGGARPWWT
ncbi:MULTISPECIES: DddA-like double-stranded DNA deaminase toxin [Actinosynnema]|uniref:DddA-like double-stranded DNA deaminase toxin n=1 Tax=Actinosynnema TaxID=40566 RepID=UPI0020A4A254|nr:DddA-like double-stranded DNA deaminase toxin [Actinosynnema pretiosum]MCP2099121.1 SCP1.201-like deaminase [Actinosynnema pretiosum]